MPDTLADLRRELAIANRILAHEGVIDAFGPAAQSRAWEYWTARLARAGFMPPRGEGAGPP